jgi:hypothetical protein
MNDNNNMWSHTDNTAMLEMLIVPHINSDSVTTFGTLDTDVLLLSRNHTSDADNCRNDYGSHDTDLANSHNDHEVCKTIPKDAVTSVVIDSGPQSITDVDYTIYSPFRGWIDVLNLISHIYPMSPSTTTMSATFHDSGG